MSGQRIECLNPALCGVGFHYAGTDAPCRRTRTAQSGSAPVVGAPVPSASPEPVEHEVRDRLIDEGVWSDSRLRDSVTFREAMATRLDVTVEDIDDAIEQSRIDDESRAAEREGMRRAAIASVIAQTPANPKRGDTVVVDRHNPRVIKIDSARGGYLSGNTVDGGPRERIEGWRADDVLREAPE